MKILHLLSLFILLFATSLSSQNMLDVEGNAKIDGRLDLGGYSNIFIGKDAGNDTLSNNENVAIGRLAGQKLGTGSNNTFLGFRAGSENAQGSSNTFLGFSAGKVNTYGHNNTFIGMLSGSSNTTGSSNVFVGKYSGQENTTGSSNSFFGNRAGNLNTTGIYNSFFGNNAGYNNTTGYNNAFFGYFAGRTNTIGYSNAFFGRLAGYENTTGNNNSFFGRNAGYENTTGNYNSFIGTQAGEKSVKGIRNTFIGSRADLVNSLDSLKEAIAIGFNAKVACHNCAVIGGTGENSVQVGIGTTTPIADLHIESNSTGSSPQIQLVEEGETDFARLRFANKTLNDYWSIAGRGNNGSNPSRWNIFYHNGSSGENILSVNGTDKRVGILDVAPSCELDVNGDVCSNGAMITSDRRFKKNIKTIKNPLEKLVRLQGVSYKMRTNTHKSRNFQEGKQLGVIAQEIEKVFPELVKTFDDGYKAVNYNGLIPVLIESVKEQQQIIDNQSITNTKLEEKLNQQQGQIDKLNQLVQTLIDKESAQFSKDKIEIDLHQKASLGQNQPNPFSKNTLIHYTLPQNTKNAFLQITALDGEVINKQAITPSKNGQITIKANDYPRGSYFYSLIANGQVLLTKQMVLTY